METRTASKCVRREATEALARDKLSTTAREQAERHLESCDSCRHRFRELTAHRFPTIANYTILSELGRGAFGTVYKAVHHLKERTEILKVLSETTAQHASFEIKSRLRHPNIATLYEANLRREPYYCAIEFIEGQNLEDYLRSHDVPLGERIQLVETLAKTVGYVHQNGIILQNLHPKNILIDSHGKPTIIDFGMTTRLGTKADEPLKHLGRCGFSSPEQIAGGVGDRRVDVYSLGALLFHVITGQSPCPGETADGLREIMRERQIPRAWDLTGIITRCMQGLPDQRYATCEDFVADLDEYVKTARISTRRMGGLVYHAVRLTTRFVRNHPFAAQAVPVFVIATIATVISKSGIASVGSNFLLYAFCAASAVLVNILPTPAKRLLPPLISVTILVAIVPLLLYGLSSVRDPRLVYACVAVWSTVTMAASALSIRLFRERAMRIWPEIGGPDDGTTAQYQGRTGPSETGLEGSRQKRRVSPEHQPRRRISVPQVPRLIQREIDRLIETGKKGELKPDERAQLEEALDYLDSLTIIELERLRAAYE